MSVIDRKITPDIQKKLTGLLPVSKTMGIPFSPVELFPGELKDFCPTFYLRGWTVEEQKGFVSDLKKAEEEQYFTELMLKYSHISLIKIDNLIDLANGQELDSPMDKGKPSFEFFSSIPTPIISAVFRKVQEISGINVSSNPIETDIDDAEGLG